MISKYQIQKDLEDGQESLNLIREDLFSTTRPSNLILEDLINVIKLLDKKFERMYEELELSEYYDITSNTLKDQKEQNEKHKG